MWEDSIVYGLIIGLTLCVLAIITLLIVYFVSVKKPKAPSNVPGSTCQTTGDCNAGLLCINNFCTIPVTGSCRAYPNNCGEGLTCTNNVCIPNVEILKIKNENCNYQKARQKEQALQQELRGTVVPINQEKTLIMSETPNMSNYKDILKGNIKGFTCFNGKVYVVTGPNTITVMSLSPKIKTLYTTNVQLDGPIAIVDGTIYVTSQKMLYSGNIDGNTVNFVSENEQCNDLDTNPQLTQLFKKMNFQDDNTVLGDNGDYLTYDTNTITYYNENGSPKNIKNDGSYPLLYNGNVYLNKYKTKAYDGIFMSVV